MFICLTHFRELGQKCRNIFGRFLILMKTLNFAFEIKWPLMRKKNQNANEESWKKACLAEKAEVLDEFFCTGKVLESSKTIKKFSSYFFLCLFLVFFQQQIFLLPFNSRHKTSSFARQSQSFGGVIKCTMRPEILNSYHSTDLNNKFLPRPNTTTPL